MGTFEKFPKDGYEFSADDVGLALAGLVRRETSGAPRVGMLGAGPKISAVAASWKVEIGIFTYVHQVDGAISLSGLSGAVQVDIVPAAGSVPAGQARIDLVCWDPGAEELTVEQGTPAVSPVVPSAGGLAPVLTVRVNAGDGMVIGGQIAAAFAVTGLVGATDPVAYAPAVSGYTAGFNPVLRAQYLQVGRMVEVEVQAETDREISRFTGNLLLTVPVPMMASPIAVEGGGFFLIGPTGARAIYDLRVRQASSTQVVLELVRVDGRNAALVPVPQGGFASTDWVSWRCRFRYTAA